MLTEKRENSFLNADQRHFATAFFLSLLLHVLLFSTGAVNFKPAPSEKRFEVSLLTPPKPAEHVPPPLVEHPALPRQIVSPTQAPVAEPIQETRLLSEHAMRAEAEKIRRGDSLVPPHPQPKPQTAPAKTAPASKKMVQPQVKSPHGVTKNQPLLRLNDEQLLASVLKEIPERKKESSKADSAEQGQEDKKRAQAFEQSEPFRRSVSATLKLGSSDYLPDVPDGDITLLNAKADRYAVFVRRVALQVFGALRRLGWQQLHYTEVRKVRGFVSVEAVMSLSGKLIQVKIVESSGSTVFDTLSSRAAQEGAWDQNPPADAAADDHQIHFLFKAKTWGRPGANGINEARWLLLGTGLL
jgi:TonB family protein